MHSCIICTHNFRLQNSGKKKTKNNLSCIIYTDLEFVANKFNLCLSNSYVLQIRSYIVMSGNTNFTTYLGQTPRYVHTKMQQVSNKNTLILGEAKL